MTHTDNFQHIKNAVESLRKVLPESPEQYVCLLEASQELERFINLMAQEDKKNRAFWDSLRNDITKLSSGTDDIG